MSKKKKNIGEGSEPRGVVWGGERVVEPGDMPLMSPFRPVIETSTRQVLIMDISVSLFNL